MATRGEWSPLPLDSNDYLPAMIDSAAKSVKVNKNRQQQPQRRPFLDITVYHAPDGVSCASSISSVVTAAKHRNNDHSSTYTNSSRSHSHSSNTGSQSYGSNNKKKQPTAWRLPTTAAAGSCQHHADIFLPYPLLETAEDDDEDDGMFLPSVEQEQLFAASGGTSSRRMRSSVDSFSMMSLDHYSICSY